MALVVRGRWPDGRIGQSTMVDRYDPAGKMTAMARTTAFTTSVMAQLAASGGVSGHGVVPPEWVAKSPEATRFVLDHMAERGVTFTHKGTD